MMSTIRSRWPALEAEDLSAEPSRLVEEAQTIPLFGGRRAVWVKAGSRNIAPAVEALLALRAIECRVVIEAGDLRPQRAAAFPVRKGEERRGIAVLRRQRARPRTADRQ